MISLSLLSSSSLTLCQYWADHYPTTDEKLSIDGVGVDVFLKLKEQWSGDGSCRSIGAVYWTMSLVEQCVVVW